MQFRTCTSNEHVGENPVPLVDFGRDKSRPDGYHSHCKACRRQKRQRWYNTNKTEILETLKDNYYLNHDANKLAANKRSAEYKARRGISWALLMSVKTRAKKRGLEFNLVEQDIVIPDVCPILGISLTREVGPRTDNYPTLDRINNSKGYTKDNVMVVSWRANELKGTATLHELVLLGEFARSYIDQDQNQLERHS
jgi:hypothetical protein